VRISRVVVRRLLATRRRRFLIASLGPFVLSATLALALLVTGLADDRLAPQVPAGTVHADGRESDDLPEPPQRPPDAQYAALVTTRFTGLALLVAAAAPARVRLAGVDCEDWRGLVASDGRPAGWPLLRQVTRIAVHNTGTAAGVAVGAQAIANWHVHGLGWEHGGYHVVVRADGRCEYALDVRYQGYHAFRFNRDSVALALESTGPYADVQLETFYRLVAGLMHEYSVPLDLVQGHRDFSRLDAEALARGERLSSGPNDHVDPCAGSRPCSWDTDRFGLNQFVGGLQTLPAPVRPSAPPNTAAPTPTPRGKFAELVPGPVPNAAVRGTFEGQGSYYDAGAVTASGVPFDPTKLRAATWLVRCADLPENDPRRAEERRSAGYEGTCPAYRFGTTLRVERTDPPHHAVTIVVTDLGRWSPAHPDSPHRAIDLTPHAFTVLYSGKVRPTRNEIEQAKRVGVQNVRLTVTGWIDPESLPERERKQQNAAETPR
jgi:hypothetical protein